ncbi:hypothetical protein MMC09_006221 [Bachmanniomyces sp. S44760]|nr:hypothetical protein [Bachmanniomyces sp. S44760]
MHATHLSRPSEQIKIIRVTALIPVFAIISFASIYLGVSAIYLVPWMSACESIALASFFLLVCNYVSPSVEGQNAYFQSMELPAKGAQGDSFPADGLAWFKKTRLLVCQYIGVAIFTAIVTDITQGASVYCVNSNSIHFAHIWLQVIKTISSAIAIIAIIKFTSKMNKRLPNQRLISKLVIFKLVVFLNLIQSFVFSIAAAKFHPSNNFSYLALAVELPAILFCVEMAIISVFFHLVYSAKPYTNNGATTQSRYQGGPLGIAAIGTALNPIDIGRGIVDGF